ncbi:hypothetical protein AB395_00006573 (plasmid) [Sinorhizobium fredii CCBAU 45436]|nr:hypothetical protein AB395_00006573 [Sinorhizobium fredii CCBAU 45436]
MGFEGVVDGKGQVHDGLRRFGPRLSRPDGDPFHAAGRPEPRRASRRGPAKRRAAEGGFLGPRGAPASASARKVGTGFRNSRCAKEVPARGRNPTDPLKARQPSGKGRLSAGPRARAYPNGDQHGPAFPATARPLPPFRPAASGGQEGGGSGRGRNDTVREILLYRSRKGRNLRKLKIEILSPPCVRA